MITLIRSSYPLGTTKEFLAWLVNEAKLNIKANKHRKFRVLKKWFNRYAVVKHKGVKVSLKYHFGCLSMLVTCEHFPITEAGWFRDEHPFVKYQPYNEEYRQCVEWEKEMAQKLINEEPLGEVTWCMFFRREKIKPFSCTHENGAYGLQWPTIK